MNDQILQEYEDRSFIIFNVSELNLINFNEVFETSAETVRISLTGNKTFVKWDGATPDFVSNLTTKEGPYTYDEIMEILNGPEWTKPFVL